MTAWARTALRAAAVSVVALPAVAQAQSAVVRGTITGPGGRAVPEAEIVVADSVRARTDSTGAFTVSFAPGARELLVRRFGFAPLSIPLTLAPGQRRTLAIELEPMAFAIDPFVVSAKRPGIFGVVVDRDGHPIVGAEVLVAGTGRTVTTSIDGAFAFADLQPSTYLVSARARRRYAARFTVTVAPGRGQELRIELGLIGSELTNGAVDVASGYFWRESRPLADLDRRLRDNREVVIPRARLALEGDAAAGDIVTRAATIATMLDASPRGPTSIDARGTESALESRALPPGAMDRGTCWFIDGFPTTNLEFARSMPASWIESIEVVRIDRTGTLKFWLPPMVDCKRYVVVWTRK